MGFFESLFGGQQEKPLWSDAQKWIQNQLIGQVGNQIGRGVEAYGGQITPGATGNQQLAFDQAGGLLGGGMGIDTSSAIQRYLSGAPAYQIDPSQSSAMFEQAVELPARQDFQDTLQGLDARYGARFGRSGAQLEAAGRAAERFGTGLSAQRANWMRADEMDRRQALERGLDRMGAGVGMAHTAQNAMDANTRANLGAVAGLGGMERGIQGQQMAEDYGKWEYERPWNNPWLGFLGTALTPEPRQMVQRPGILSGALQGGMMGAQLGGPWGAALGAVGGGALAGSGWF